jgi:mannose-6-phosphate isomerase-like protein (cupin superfamily)
MAYNDEHIFQLILEKLSGAISDENRLYLEQAAREDDNIKRCIEEMEDAARVAGAGFMDDIYNEIAWSNVLSLLDNEQQSATRIITTVPERVSVPAVRDTRAWWIAAATIAVISSVVYFFFSGTDKPVNSIVNNKITIPLQGNIQLILDNGDTLQLPGSESQIATLSEENPHLPAGIWGTLIVPAGKDYIVTLTDGSAIHINAFSSLRFPVNFTGKTREVFLSGEAFFTIAPDAKQSFIVHSGQTAVKVLGTSFNINAYSDSLVITSLVQGSVITQDNGEQEVRLKPGMETIYQKGSPHIIRPFDENITLAWRKGEYNYNNESLAALDIVILHWYGKQLLFDKTTLAAKKLTGIIERDKPLTDFLDGLGKTSGLTYRINEDKIYLTEK